MSLRGIVRGSHAISAGYNCLGASVPRCLGASVPRCLGHYRASDSRSSQPGRLKPQLPKKLSFLERELLISDPLKRKRLKPHLLSFRFLNGFLKLSPLALTAALAVFCAGLFAVAGA